MLQVYVTYRVIASYSFTLLHADSLSKLFYLKTSCCSSTSRRFHYASGGAGIRDETARQDLAIQTLNTPI